MKPSERKYTGPLQYFHNYEHDTEGRTHCLGPESNPYIIIHQNGKHLINTEYAVGHDKSVKRQWFRFDKKIGDSYDLSSGEMVDSSDVPKSKMKSITLREAFAAQKEEQLRMKRHLGH